jgi:uncharacterized protein involved in tolerance to divalent cations
MKIPFTRKIEKKNELVSLIHTRIAWKSMFISFINDHHKYGNSYLIKYNFESFNRFKKFINKVKT